MLNFSKNIDYVIEDDIKRSQKNKLPYYERKKIELYKTEICRSYEENGYCRYNEKCQFAHSIDELRKINRHPRYKTEICKTYWEEGTCPYGKRCCFIHKENIIKDQDIEVTAIGMSEEVNPVKDKSEIRNLRPFYYKHDDYFDNGLLYVRIDTTFKDDERIPGAFFVPKYDKKVAKFVLDHLDL
ncbi:CCCH-type Zn-finger protein [Trachipleistophora hominis]|uniref:CCCH-type Zn-finger protein n=1 Tax=Trachipleistophora hominis TaxID=72359 RepID=L7JRY0_TRAHO|nr:CCCH-type Zn-finger protein [Trachipleistophora hominis]